MTFIHEMLTQCARLTFRSGRKRDYHRDAGNRVTCHNSKEEHPTLRSKRVGVKDMTSLMQYNAWRHPWLMEIKIMKSWDLDKHLQLVAAAY